MLQMLLGDLWTLMVAAGGPLAGAGRSETSGWAHVAVLCMGGGG